MQKTLLLFLLFTLKLFSYSDGFSICQNKALDADAFSDASSVSVALKHNNRLIYSKKTPNFAYKKYDPYLGLALVEDKSHFKYPFVFYTKHAKRFASIYKNSIQEGKILNQQCGLNKFAKFSKPIKELSLILSNCCDLAGIATKDGVIDRYYLENFLNYKAKDVVYGDVGIRLDKNLHVISINPFFKIQNFLKNDKILAFDSIKTDSICKLRRLILFAKIGSFHTFKILRNNKIKYIKAKVEKRLGGGLLNDTFLEYLGFSLDKNLCIENINSKEIQTQLNIGDCLIEVNFHKVNLVSDIQNALKRDKLENTLLFERNNFQFFIHINGKNGRITKKND